VKTLLLFLCCCTLLLDAQQRFLIEERGQYGYIDSAGTTVIEPQYFARSVFSEGKAKQLRNRWLLDNEAFFLNPDGSTALETHYNEAGNFSEGLAKVLDVSWALWRYWGFIDANGKEVIAPEYSDAGDFHNGMRVGGETADPVPRRSTDIHLYGFINTAGRLVVSYQYRPRRTISPKALAMVMH
jgi:hypothetical protein